MRLMLEKFKFMLEILQFIFSSFWIWLGTYILLISLVAIIRGSTLIQIGKNDETKIKSNKEWIEDFENKP